MNESLSALLDGECSASELDHILDQWQRDPALRSHYSRLCMARDSAQGVRVRPGLDLAASVMAALDAEPSGAAVLPFRSRWTLPWKPLAGLAAAAALGGIAVLAIPPNTAKAPDLQGPDRIESVAAEPTAPEPEPRWAVLNDDASRQLQNYLMAYSQSRAQQGVGGTLGSARFAAYTEPRVSDRDP